MSLNFSSFGPVLLNLSTILILNTILIVRQHQVEPGLVVVVKALTPTPRWRQSSNNLGTISLSLSVDVAVVLVVFKMRSHVKQGLHVFDIPAVASSIGFATTDVLAEIQTLKMKGEVTYEMKDPAFCYTILEVPREICSLSSHLTKWLAEIETCKVRKLDIMSSAAVAAINVSNTSELSAGAKQTQSLQSRILNYFNGDGNCDTPSKTTQNCSFLRADIKVFLQSNRQAKFTPRAIARIMHGVGSPAFPNSIWSKTHFWGRYMSVDFSVIMEAAQTELLNCVDRNAALAA
ncbi:unnamed protein product [Microthlaspi erraticum]|uniref:Uncharacterized protein n=1 Tax=Microthlaspi erraticum TaxID=1685480 RepID=A0A6D2HXG6_9BRAS|nr:unnamed protein product [Microthlaspi erraticum]